MRLKFENLSKKCLICEAKNDTIYFHVDKNSVPWLFCNRCDDSMDLADYCEINNIESPTQEEIDRVSEGIKEANELTKMAWPRSFIPLWNSEAAEGVKYLESRGIKPSDGLYYDLDKKGIVFPYYYDSTCVGAQIRFIDPKEDGTKITTVTGTRLGKLFYNWNQGNLPHQTKYLVVTEGAFNAIALQQTFNNHYKSLLKNPYRFIATSGSSIGTYRADILKELIEEGIKVILAADGDEAGTNMLEKAIKLDCITHWSSVDSDDKDWNDILVEKGETELGNQFLRNLRKI